MADYYCAAAANGGDDGNAGTQLSPFLTLSHAITTIGSAAGTAYGNGGDRFRETATMGYAGQSVVAYGTGVPIIDGADIKTGFVADAGLEETDGVFASGFEAETSAFTTAFTGKVEANSNTCAVESSVVNHGSNAAVITYAGSAGNLTYFYKTFAGQSKYLRCYFKLDAAFAAGAAAENMIVFGSDNFGGWDVQAAFILFSDAASATQFHLGGYYRRPGTGWTQVFLNADNSLNRGQWYCLEMHYEKSTSATVEFWIDGASQGSAAAVNSNSYNANGLCCGAGIATFGLGTVMVPTAGSNIYFDDVKAANSAIGAYSAPAGVAHVYNVACSATSQVFINGARATAGASKAALTNGQWYYSGGTLSVCDTNANPDTDGWLVEASVRDYGVNANGKNGLALTNLHLTRANLQCLGFTSATAGVTLTGCTLDYAYQNGVRSITGAAVTSVLLDHCAINWNGASGTFIGKGSHDWTVQYCTFTRNCQFADDVGDHNYSSAIHAWCDDESCYNLLFQWNTTTQNGLLPDGTTYIAGVRGQGVHMDTTRLTNYTTPGYIKIIGHFSDRDNYVGINCEHTSYVQVLWSVASTVHSGDGIRFGDYTHITSLDSSYNLAYHCVAYGCSRGFYVCGASASVANTCVGNAVRNCIGYNNGRNLACEYGAENDGTNGHGNIYDYNALGAEGGNIIGWGVGNVLTAYAAWQASAGAGVGVTDHYVVGDPQFVDAAGGDFHLQYGSPCLQAGVYIAGISDANPPDIGAFQNYFGAIAASIGGIGEMATASEQFLASVAVGPTGLMENGTATEIFNLAGTITLGGTNESIGGLESFAADIAAILVGPSVGALGEEDFSGAVSFDLAGALMDLAGVMGPAAMSAILLAAGVTIRPAVLGSIDIQP